MKRREFLTKAAIAGSSIPIACPALAQSTPSITWRLASSYPKSLDTIYGSSTALAEAVSTMTDGRFTIQVLPAGEVVPPLQVADAVSNGIVEMGHSAAYFYVGKDTAFAFGTTLPWMANSRQYQSWLYRGGGNDLFNEFLSSYSLVHLPGGNTGAQMAGWYRKEIKSRADFNGLKMRIGGLGGNLLQRLGVVPQQLPAGDIYPALERGVIDAVEFVGPYDDEKLGFVKVAPFYYYPGFWEGSAELSYFVGTEKWNGLPKQYQAALRHAAKSTGLDMLCKYDSNNAVALRRLVAAGAQLRALPEGILEESYRQSRLMYAEMSNSNPKFKKLYDHLSAFLADSNSYVAISDFYFDYMQITARRKNWDRA